MSSRQSQGVNDALDQLDDDDFPREGRMTVDSLLSDSIVYVDADSSIRTAAVALTQADVGLVVVGSHGDVVGVVSERDIVRAVATGADLDEMVVKTIETEDLKWATTDAPIDDVAEEMLEYYLRHVLVGDDDGVLAGVVSMRDILAVYVV